MQYQCTIHVQGGSVAADLVPVWEPSSEGRAWRPAEPAISGTFRNCGKCTCCNRLNPRGCVEIDCCKEIVCGDQGCMPPKVLYCGCDLKTCVVH
ncbi:hypothetical protein BRADI_1g53819v3 [Brachypodium distachyon]|uniref:Uncharacterized protein n=1 Tax=Brachypodium distachyon TaxID=15368 RepID=A0A2K2DRB5_BRADI|nr:hypothetical protein BRADI_1g53819v3 [Brachypodium distachyon]